MRFAAPEEKNEDETAAEEAGEEEAGSAGLRSSVRLAGMLAADAGLPPRLGLTSEEAVLELADDDDLCDAEDFDSFTGDSNEIVGAAARSMLVLAEPELEALLTDAAKPLGRLGVAGAP